MIKFYSLTFLALMAFPLLAVAEEDADAALKDMATEAVVTQEANTQYDDEITQEEKNVQPLADEDTNYEERLKLSRAMHEIWPSRPKIENALEVISQQIEPTKRLEFKSGMRNAIEYDALEVASIDAMADIFTAAELQKMIDFYGSKEGRSVSFKTTDYEQALIPIMTKMVDKALLDVKLGK